MKPNVITYEEDTPIRTIYEFLCRVAMRRIVIVKDGRPTGTISRGTLLRLFRNLVISHNLLDRKKGDESSMDTEMQDSRNRLEETARQMSLQATELQYYLQNNSEDLMPNVIGGATSMQELVNDLLAHAQYANPRNNSPAAMKMMMTEGNCVE